MRLIGVVLVVLLSSAAYVAAEPGDDPCGNYSSILLVDPGYHFMHVCKGHREIRRLRVALGRGGINKQKKGDLKTPVGLYMIGKARPSDRFFIFIPLNYPTDEQYRNGFTGDGIGIHGPHRYFKSMGEVSTSLDWTQGCIALGSDEEVLELVHLITEERIEQILIMDDDLQLSLMDD
ncbi:MAG: L,D-transpeptidase family protein [Thermodesulfovibrionales bacterium]